VNYHFVSLEDLENKHRRSYLMAAAGRPVRAHKLFDKTPEKTVVKMPVDKTVVMRVDKMVVKMRVDGTLVEMRADKMVVK
jgi:hypothetical protein